MLKVGSRTFPPPNYLVPSLSGALVAALLLLPTTAGAWTYKEAAAPYAGTTINILDEVTPLQESMATLVPEFIEETGNSGQLRAPEPLRRDQPGSGGPAVRPRRL
jgi:hypothetical protein